MKKFLLLFLFLVNVIQAQSGKVIYAIQVSPSANTVKAEQKVLMETLLQNANLQEFQLLFNSTSSSFKSIESMNTLSAYEAQINTIAKLAFTSADEIYFDKNAQTEYIKKDDGLIVKDDNLSSNWTITTNSKLIGSYLCYEGILKRTFINRKGETKTKEIIAWFAPQLPYSYGPKDFHGLPGLILELYEDKTVYSAKNIELIKDEQNIYFPKGRTISKEEYEKKLESSAAGVIIGKKREKEKNSQ